MKAQPRAGSKFSVLVLFFLPGAVLWLASGRAWAQCPAPTGGDFKHPTNLNFHALWEQNHSAFIGGDFTGAMLNGADFDGVDLTGAVFTNASLGTDADGNQAVFDDANLTRTCFQGAQLTNASFDGSQFACTDFSNTKLNQADFGETQDFGLQASTCRTNFDSSTMSVTTVPYSLWHFVSFNRTTFTDITPSTLAGQDITGASLQGQTFRGFDLTAANLTGVDFTSADLSNAKLDNAALNGANLTSTRLQSATATCAQFFGSQPQPGCSPPTSTLLTTPATLTRATLAGANFTSATFDSAVLTGANLAGGNFTHASFQQANFQSTSVVPTATVLGANFTGANFTSAHLDGVSFNATTLIGANFSAISLNGSDFSSAVMPAVNFSGAQLQGVSFYQAILQNADFTGANLQNGSGGSVNFSCTQMGGVNLSKATLAAANFQSAVLPTEGCCSSNGATVCGTINSTGVTYGLPTLPVLTTAITCPNGDTATCTGAQWEIPNWQTSLCSASGVNKTVWTPPSCGGQPSGPNVVFKDANLKACILAALPGNPTELPIVTAKLLTDIYCPDKNISSLDDLANNFGSLVTLNVSGNKIAGFNLHLNALQTLHIDNNQLTTLNLLGTANLTTLSASGNHLTAVAGWNNISLNSVDLSNNQISKLDLPIQTSLTFVDLSNNALTSVLDPYQTTLKNLTQLQTLNLANNSLGTIGSAAAIGNPGSQNQPPVLTKLYLSCNATFACSTLALDTKNGDSPALGTSSCAVLNTNTNVYAYSAHPSCDNAHPRPPVSREHKH